MNLAGSPSEPFYGSGSPNDSLPISAMPTAAVCVSAGLSASNIALGACLIIGAFLSYGPQYYAIWRRKSTEGLNIFTIGLGVCAQCCVMMNFLYLKWNAKLACCNRDGFGKCLAHTLDGQQIAVPVICLLIWCAMWLWYYKIDESPEVVRPLEELEHRAKKRMRVLIFFCTAIGVLLVNIVLAGLFNVVWKVVKVAQWIGFLLGIVGTVCVILQWGPQIWTTWKLKAVGSLSVLMLLIQLPGTLVVIYFQGVVNDAHWSTVLPYVVNAIEFTILLGLCGFFITRDWWRMRTAAQIAEQHPDYAFSHLDENIRTTRKIITDPTNADEAEAEAMMNLEFDDEDDLGLASDSDNDQTRLTSHQNNHLSRPQNTHTFTASSSKPNQTSFKQNNTIDNDENNDDDPSAPLRPSTFDKDMNEVRTLLKTLEDSEAKKSGSDESTVKLDDSDDEVW